MTDKPKVACPECGNTEGIYACADIRWDAIGETWTICAVEALLDCTECDHNWELPSDWPHPTG